MVRKKDVSTTKRVETVSSYQKRKTAQKLVKTADALIEEQNRYFLTELPQRALTVKPGNKSYYPLHQCLELVLYLKRFVILLDQFTSLDASFRTYVQRASSFLNQWDDHLKTHPKWLPTTTMKTNLFGFLTILTSIFSRYQHDVFPNTGSTPVKTLGDTYIWWFFPQHNPITRLQKDICDHCKGSLVHQNSMQMCNCSGLTRQHFSTVQSHSDYSNERATSHHDYKRTLFMQRHLSQYQQGSKRVDIEVLKDVKRELLRRQILSKHDVKMTTVKDILTQLGHTAYINHPDKIANLLNDVEIAEFTKAQLNEIIERVRAVEDVHGYLRSHVAEHNIKRVNFPAIRYFIRQCCQINGWTDLVKRFKLHKMEESRARQEREWKTYIHYLRLRDPKHHWVFIPTK